MSVYEALVSTTLDVRDYRVPGYRGHGIAPRGVLVHHTASPKGSGDLPSLGVCLNGRSGLPGPLCQVLIGRAGTVAVVTDGLANHAGIGEWSGITSGNQQLVGVEVENDGAGEPYSPGVYSAIVTVTRALCAHFGVGTVIGHKEWAPGRKIDPLFDMNEFRAAVTAQEEAMTPEDKQYIDGRFSIVEQYIVDSETRTAQRIADSEARQNATLLAAIGSITGTAPGDPSFDVVVEAVKQALREGTA